MTSVHEKHPLPDDMLTAEQLCMCLRSLGGILKPAIIDQMCRSIERLTSPAPVWPTREQITAIVFAYWQEQPKDMIERILALFPAAPPPEKTP